MNNLEDLPEGVAAKLRAIEDEEDDDVDHRIPTTWGVNDCSEVFRFEYQAFQPASSTSSRLVSPEARSGFAPAFAPLKKRVDPYQPKIQKRGFSFSSARPTHPRDNIWNTFEPNTSDRSEKSRGWNSQSSTTGGRADVDDPRNRALEGIFGTTSVKRVTEENSEWLDLTLPELDHNLEDPNLDIDPNVRANFVPINQLYRAQSQRSAFALRNPTLIASNTGGSILTVIAGETITYTPKPGDPRLSRLDRHGNYVGEYEGEIKKSLKRKYVEDVEERDRQMLQATAEYRALAAMTAEERTELLESLRKPFEWQGAFEEDIRDEHQIPEVYSREIETERVMAWMEGDISPRTTLRGGISRTSDSVRGPRGESINTDAPLGNFEDLDGFAAGSSFLPFEKSAERTQQYCRDVLHFSRKQALNRPSSQRSSSTINSQIANRFGRAKLSDTGTNRPLTATDSTRGLSDLFSFDDSPEFQTPDDCPIAPETQMTSEQAQLYKNAVTLSRDHGRVVLVHLHELVKFTPGAIAHRVFGGIIQEMQLFPVQGIAIVIFVHPSDAKAFVRHVKKVHECGLAEEIRALQIEVAWYKGFETPHSILPTQPHILTHHILSHATRCLRLHHLPSTKTKEDISLELGQRLAMPLLTIILSHAKLSFSRSGRDGLAVSDARLETDAWLGADARRGRQAIVEFVSISDAIRARELLEDGSIDEYKGCEPVFAGDPSSGLVTERGYCGCKGCKYQRKQKGL